MTADLRDLPYLHEPRDPHGKWTKGGALAAAAKTVKPEDDDAARQDAARRQLLAYAQKQISIALNTPPEKMTSQQVMIATRVITNMTNADVTRLTSKLDAVVPKATVDHVESRLTELLHQLHLEQGSEARKKLIVHIAGILAAVALGLAAAGFVIPAAIVTLLGVMPELIKELGDFRIEGGRLVYKHRRKPVQRSLPELRTARTPIASTVPEPHGKPGGGLFGVKGLMAPPYIEHVAGELMKQGHSESDAYHMAVGIVEDWAAGHTGQGKPVHPDVQAAAARNVAQWKALVARYAHHGRSAGMGAEYRAQMSTADINDLPDSAFAFVKPGMKDPDNKTIPRTNRHLPIHDAAHVRNALARLPQTDELSSDEKAQAKTKIMAAAKKFGVDADSDDDGGRSHTGDVENRTTPGMVEVRSSFDGPALRIGGYASVFGVLSRNLGGFVERVDNGAFNRSRVDGWPHVVCRYNHDPNMVLGTAPKTLELRVDRTGLDYSVLPPQSRQDILELVERGDIRFSSFAFRCAPGGDAWSVTDQNFPMRTLHDLELIDVAPVLSPAYTDATAGLRSLAAAMSTSYEEVRSMAEADELRKFFIRTDRSSGMPPAKPPRPKISGPAAMLELMGKRFPDVG